MTSNAAMVWKKRTAGRGRLMLVTMSLARSGGAEVQVGDLALGMAARGWDVEVVSLLDVPTPVDFALAGIGTCSLGMQPGAASLGAFRRFLSHVRQSRPDVVHSHMTHPNLLARAARPFVPMPVLICTLHGYKMYSVQSGSYRVRELAHRVTDRLADRTTVVCEAAAERYRRNGVVSPERLLMVPNGIETGPYNPDEATRLQVRKSLGLRDEFVWLAAGRLEPVKDYGTMLRAFARSLGASAPQVLLIAGSGSESGAMEKLAAELGIASRVRFLGLRGDVPDLMQAADGFVLSSIFEGLPIVLLEAGASGLPMVATEVGGNGEVVVDGEGGFLVPSRNPYELGKAMQRVATLSDAERVGMGWAARAHVLNRYRMQAVLDTWEELYRKLAGERLAAERVEV